MSETSPLKTFIAAKGALIHNGKVLFLREAGSYRDGTNPGKYDVPGGRIEPGENILDCLAREVREETGLCIDTTQARPFHVLDWKATLPDEVWHITAVYFALPVAGIEVTVSGEHDAYEWLDPSQPATIPLMKNYDVILSQLCAQCGDLLARKEAA